ncbi:MAG: SCO family protein [Solirubrobacterales bacterium]
MSVRTRLALLALASIAAAALLVVMLANRSRDGESGAAAIVEDAQAPRTDFDGAVRPLTAPRDFALRDQDGRLVRTRDLRGRVVIVSPMYTTCEDTCPQIAQQIRDALLDIGTAERRQVVALAISVDPPNDTAESARRFLDTRRVRPFLDFLIGSRAELRPVWRDYGFSEQTKELEHNAYVVLLDREGRQRVGFPVQHLTPEAMQHDIGLLLAEERS